MSHEFDARDDAGQGTEENEHAASCGGGNGETTETESVAVRQAGWKAILPLTANTNERRARPRCLRYAA